MKKNESDKKKRDYFAVSLALAKKKHAYCPHVPMSPYPSNLYLVPAHFGREL